MNNDFLDGIDEQFQRLMKLNGKGKRNGRSPKSSDDSLILDIVDKVEMLSIAQKHEVLGFIQSLTHKVE